jgi:hypothetical protein
MTVDSQNQIQDMVAVAVEVLALLAEEERPLVVAQAVMGFSG